MKKSILLITSIFLFSCNSAKKVQEEDISQSVKNPNMPERVYFKGLGDNPSWTLAISTNQISFLNTVNSELLLFNHVEPVNAMDANIKKYTSKSKDGEIKITISNEKCTDVMSSNEYNYSIKIDLKKKGDSSFKDYKGCGNYILDYRLHDIWILEEMEGTVVSETDFNRRPYVEINAEESRFGGISGCNNMMGRLFNERNLLRFSAVASTRMMCTKMESESKFLKSLQSVTKYEIKNNRLYLSNPDGMKLVFKKGD